MIARVWYGDTPGSKGDQYADYLMKTGVKELRATEGNRGVYVLRRVTGEHAEFVLVSLWDSFDAIRKFAGSDIEKAVYYPEDKDFLIELEPNVTHYEVLLVPERA
jgi:heme-degrading monooxygenase HmoA